jgi:hypothetical protein
VPCNEVSPAGPSIRQRIVDALSAILSTHAALAGRVYVFAPAAFADADLPALNLRDAQETDEGKCGNCSVKNLTFTADIIVAQQAGSDWYLRQWAQEIQALLLQNSTIFGLADETRLASNEIALGQAGYIAGGIRLTFTVRYRVKLS